ncbi:MAG: tryptophan 7-halogenase [Phycisphaerales bacterium]|nr:tryptophan 7-halogenase [Phycisphaerales bacterium]
MIADTTYDAAVIGGGPAGATAALCCARGGLSVIVLEKDTHPRFHIGESFLPRHYALLRELGLLDRFHTLPQVPKFGASFVMGNGEKARDFWFKPGPHGEESHAASLERAPFDQMVVSAAREAGAVVHESTGVRSIDRLGDGDVALTTTAGPVRARVLLDASGQGAVAGRHLGTRRQLPDLRRVAYYSHFTGVERREGRLGGSPIIVMCQEGWFWVIPLDEQRTSVGMVIGMDIIKAAGIAPDRALAWGIERTPYLRRIMAGARATDERNHVTADFSHRCEPFAGPGYFLVGDAATFVDPIFSTGVCMGMMSGRAAATAAAALLREPRRAERLRRDYARFVDGSSSVFFGMVRRYYRHGFREMFLNGTGPCGVHDAVIAVLAGHVFPRPVFALRWRLRLFKTLLDIHERIRPLVPKQPNFSLLTAGPAAA